MINVENLTKKYGKFLANDNVSLRLGATTLTRFWRASTLRIKKIKSGTSLKIRES